MNKESIKTASNSDVLHSLEQLNKGNRKPSNQLVFNPSTGEFELARPNDSIPADATTINSIAQDGFASKKL